MSLPFSRRKRTRRERMHEALPEMYTSLGDTGDNDAARRVTERDDANTERRVRQDRDTKKTPPSPDDVTQPEEVHVPPPPLRDKAAAWVANACSTTGFAVANLVWWGIWLPTRGFGADPSPFQLLTLCLSFEAILLTVFVLVQQRLDATAREKEAEADLKNNAIAAQVTIETRKQLDAIRRDIRALRNDLPAKTIKTAIAKKGDTAP